jgi:Flp pilus assembly protein TadG
VTSKSLRSDSGTSLIEFALVAPILIFMLIGLIEVGRYAMLSIVAANSARAGVQYGAQSLATATDTTGIKNAAVQDGLNLSNWTASGGGVTAKSLCTVNGGALQTCTTSTNGPPANTIYYVSVQVTGTFKSLMSYPGIPTNIPVSGKAVMRVINQ